MLYESDISVVGGPFGSAYNTNPNEVRADGNFMANVNYWFFNKSGRNRAVRSCDCCNRHSSILR